MRAAFFSELDNFAFAGDMSCLELIQGISLDPRIVIIIIILLLNLADTAFQKIQNNYWQILKVFRRTLCERLSTPTQPEKIF